jgi:hypothetical protein
MKLSTPTFIGFVKDEQDFINGVRNYALQNYDVGGWDEVVEAWDDGDILEYFSDANSDALKAFKALAEMVKIRYDYAEDIRKA